MSVFKVQVSQDEKLRMKCRGEKHEMLVDEPISVGGTDRAMNPMEALLSSFGACMCVHAWALAERLNIKLKNILFELEGETGPCEKVGKITPVGLKKVHTHITVDADNTKEEIAEFIKEIEVRCPIRNTLINTVGCTSDYEMKNM
ncbi:MAG: OsmC family protein [Bacillota bacterium]|nr:OsmC family protein [Bacillota bacterium]